MKKTMQKIISTMLIVLMCLTSAPLKGFIDLEFPEFNFPSLDGLFSKEAEAASELVTDTDDAITRAEWLHNLAVVFEMTVEDEIYPDNYFNDLEDTHEYYYDVLLNVNFGVVDVEAGGDVEPDGLVTRSFASHTLNFCLGYQLEDDTYTFSDAAECEYPADAQVAVNREWVELVDGAFCPENTITDKEVKIMLDDAMDVLGKSEIDVNYDSEFTFSSEVIEIEEGTEVEIDGNIITIYDTGTEIEKDSIFAVFKSGIPLIYKADSVSANETATVVTATYIEDAAGTYLLKADAQGEANLEDVIITPAEGVDVNVNYEEEPVSTYSLKKTSNKKTFADITAKGSVKIGPAGYSVSYSVKLKNPTIKYSYNILKRTAQVTFDCDIENSVSFKADLIESGPISKEVLICNLGVIGVGGLDVYLKFGLSGEVAAVIKSSCKVGASYSPDDGFRTIKNFSGNTFSFEMKLSGSAGVIVKLGVTQIHFIEAYVFAEAGGKASVDLKIYESGTPKNCIEFAAYVYANYGTTFKLKAGPFSFEKKVEEKIWDSKTSPAKIVKHYEEEKPVVKCTRGDSGSSGTGVPGAGGGGSRGGYYTKYDSAYSGGWSDGDNSYGFDKSGNKVQLFDYSLDADGNATITGYRGNATVVNIPETIDGYKVVGIGKNAFKNNKALQSVIMPDSIVNIGDVAFGFCSNLSSINLSKSLTSLGGAAFVSCNSLKSIEIPKSLIKTTTGATISFGDYRDGPFWGCPNLKSIIFEEGITTICNNLFSNCSGIERVEIPDTVTKISDEAFSYCNNLKEIKMYDSVTSIGDVAFGFCSNLSSINLSKSLTSLGGAAFVSCNSLKSIEIPKSLIKTTTGATISFGDYRDGPFWGCVNLKSITFEKGITTICNNLFSNCSGIERVEIPDTVTKISDEAFSYCNNLKEIKMYDSVTSIGDVAFGFCSNLSSINLSKSLTSLGGAAFVSCDSLKSIEIPKSLIKTTTGATISFGDYRDGPFWGCVNLKSITFEKGIITICNNLFSNCSGIERVEIPDTVTLIEKNAFADCVNLQSVKLPANLTTIESEAFYNCSSLSSILLPNSLKSIDNSAFAYSGLETVLIPDSVTAMEERIFQGCASLKTVKLPNTRENILEYVFSDCSSLEKIEFPSTVKTVWDNAFLNCTSLKEVVFNNGLETIKDSAFKNCDALTIVNIPDSVNSIGSSAFNDCDALTTITIPDSVNSIGSSVFYDCDTLTNVTLGTGLTALPASTFEHCDVLESVVLPYRTVSVGSNVFKDCVKLTSVTIPRATTSIPTNAFSYPAKLTIYGVAGTYAETYANEIGAKFVDKQVNATAVTVDKPTVTLNKGQSTKLVMTVTPADFTDEVSWKSGDTNIATIAEDGTLTAKNVGTATIKLTVGGVSTTCKVTVVQPVTSVNIDKSSVTMQAHDTYQLKLTVKPDNAENKAVEWSSSASDIASVDQNGLVTALKKGEATIRVDAKDGSGKYDTCKIIVSNNGVIATDVAQLESSHNYPVNCTDFWQYTLTDADSISVTFDTKTNIEDGFDYLYIYDGKGNEVGKYTGTELAGKTITINDNTVRIKIVSDDSGTEWGFKVTEIKSVSAHSHSYTSEITQAATCSNTGTKTFTCTCGDEYTEKIGIDANAHKWDNGTITTTATCKVSGVKTYTCQHNTSHKKTEDLGLNGSNHINTKNVAEVKATCTTKGYTAGVYCNDCEKYISGHTEIGLDVNAHKWDNGTITTTATCKVNGVKTYTCQYNSDHKKTESLGVNASNHVNTKNVAEVKATCTTKGSTAGVYCNDCEKYVSGHTEIPVDTNAHKWDNGTITTTATCKVSGVKTYICQHNSSHKKTENLGINASNHVNTKNVAEVKATCTTKGYTAGVYCNDCQKYISGHKEIAVNTTNHVNTKKVPETPATFENIGYTAGVYCNDCKKYISGHVEIPKLVPEFTDSKDAKESGNNIVSNNGLTVAQLLSQAGKGAVIKTTDGKAVTNADLIGTGMVLTMADGSKKEIVVYGDSDGDGKISAADARLALRASVGLEKYSEDSCYYKAANVESKDKLSAADARLILRASVGLEDPKSWLK